jgi:hypothetical protein
MVRRAFVGPPLKAKVSYACLSDIRALAATKRNVAAFDGTGTYE